MIMALVTGLLACSASQAGWRTSKGGIVARKGRKEGGAISFATASQFAV